MHELDFTRGQAAIAYRGATPWHGLGESILPQDSIDDIRIKAGLDYDVVKTPVQYGYEKLGPDMLREIRTRTSKDRCVLHRSDTGDDLSVVSNKYQVVQPRQIVEFYRNLVEQYGFEIEVVGALKGGRKVWALANTGNAFQLRDRDDVKGYLLLATSYDGTMATQARFTSVRVVCNNTLSLASSQGRADVTVPHSTTFDASKVQLDLKIGPAWDEYQRAAREAPIASDRGGNHEDADNVGRMDCLDHSHNVLVLLQLLVDKGWLRHHRLLGQVHRTPLLFVHHATVAVHDVTSGQDWVIDSWFRDFGAPPVVVPLAIWKEGFSP